MVFTESRVTNDVSLITNDDIYLFNEGSHFGLYDKLGSHLLTTKTRLRALTLLSGHPMPPKFLLKETLMVGTETAID